VNTSALLATSYQQEEASLMIVQGESERLAIVLGAGKGCARNCG
jgi:hypothetical protein